MDRGPELRSYRTPVVISHAGRDELIVNTSRRLGGWDPRTGKLRRHAGFPVQLAIGVPVHHDGLVYIATENGILTVTDADTGDVVWRERTEAAGRAFLSR